MGWKLFPPHFCAVTETIADVTNTRINQDSKEQKLHKFSESTNLIEVQQGTKILLDIEQDPNLPDLDKPQAMTEIFVDNFVLLAQSNEHTFQRLCSILFMVIDEVLRSNNSLDKDGSTKEPISLNNWIKAIAHDGRI